jgi:ADP-heptose:LPS heptosyltransferase
VTGPELAAYAEPLREMTGPYRARSGPLVAALRLLDAAGRAAPRRAATPPTDRPLRVLVANGGHLGDIVSLLPLLRRLDRHPRVGELGLLVGRWGVGVLQATDLSARIHVLDHWALDRGPGGRIGKAGRYLGQAATMPGVLAQHRYDVSIDTFSTFPTTHVLTWRAGIPMRIGFDSGGGGGWLTHPVAWRAEEAPVAQQQLALLRPLFGAAAPSALPAVYPGYRPAALPPDLGISGSGHVILHMGSGAASRDWDTEHWIWLARQLRAAGLEVAATGAPGREAEAAADVAERAGIVSLAGRLDWPQFVTVVAQSAAVVAVDTVIGHLAACFQAPTVVLTAGRQRLAYWRPNNPRAVQLTHPVACQPCFRTDGCEAMACVRRIEAGTVLDTLRRLLGERAIDLPRE